MRTKRQNWIPVVTALMHRQGQVLLGQRPEGLTLPGVWEFPGGKIELGESPELALFRELKEELGIEAKVGPLMFATTHQYGNTGILLLFFEVRFWKGELKPVHHQNLKWFRPEALKNISLPEANHKVLPQILSALRGQPADCGAQV